MAVANSTAAARSLRSTPKKPVKLPPDVVGVIEHLEPAVHRLVARALRAMERSAVYRAALMSSPVAARDYLRLRLAPLEHEEFVILWLDSQHRLIAADTIGVGTLTQASVYPREVVKAGLARNAGACILAHNHPSGETTPSLADQSLTHTLKEALAVVDIKVLDHIIVGGTAVPLSFAERGLL